MATKRVLGVQALWDLRGFAWLAFGLAIATPVHGETAPESGADLEQARVQYAPSPGEIRAFRLIDHTSRVFTGDDLEGRTSLVFFGFTNCRSVCPPTMTKLRQVARALADAPAPVTNIMFSADSERDTPAVMAKFLEPFMPGFVGVTGDATVIRDVADDFSAVFFKGMPTDSQGGYNVEHTPQVYLVDRTGRLRATFYNASVEAMVDATRRVMLDD